MGFTTGFVMGGCCHKYCNPGAELLKPGGLARRARTASLTTQKEKMVHFHVSSS